MPFYSKKYSKIDRLFRVIRKEGWSNMKRDYGFTCPRCGRKEPEITLTKDHVLPKSRGGTDDLKNIQPLCIDCNQAKNQATEVFVPLGLEVYHVEGLMTMDQTKNAKHSKNIWKEGW